MECRVCKLHLPKEQFYCISPVKGWYRRECKSCTRVRHSQNASDSREAIRAYNREYRQKNRQKLNAQHAVWNAANIDKKRKSALYYYYGLQSEAINRYGGYVCVWCGIDEPLVLGLDHINNDGKEHRKQMGSTGGHRFYKWLRDNGYPPGFQVLCMNCNQAKYRNGGVIPESLKGRCNDHSERK